jgi:peptide/nickel transport system permease protein
VAISTTVPAGGAAGGRGRLAAVRARRLAYRAVSVMITLVGLLVLTFFMGRLLPADPVIAVVGPEATREVYERTYQELGLDRPVWEQFFSYLGRVAQGDLGQSLTTGHAVADDLVQVFPATIELALVALLVGTLLGVPLGVVAAVRHGSIVDHVARIIGLAGHSIPIFWLALMALFLFYAKLQWVGASGRVDVFFEGMVEPTTGFLLIDSALAGEWEVFWSAVNHIILPGCLLGYYSTAYISRMTRSFMLEQLGQDYIITARAKGLKRRAVIWRHAFLTIRVQLLTVLALTFGGLLDGTVLLETVFGWPGLGQYLTRGLQFNDMNIVMGAVLLIGILFLTVNTITDILYRILDPRTR